MRGTPLEKLLEKIPSKYAVTVAVSKRAEQLSHRTGDILRTDDRHPITVAMEEIGEGRVRIRIPNDNEEK